MEHKVLAIDIGTASVSAAVAETKKGGKADVRNVFRYHYDASSPDNSRLLLNAVSKAFLDAHKFEKGISTIKIGFSFPFFVEQSMGGEIKRENPQIAVSADEVNNLLLSATAGLPKNLEAVYCDILSSKIDGYEVPEPYGYKGQILKVDAKVFAINSFLKTRIEELKDKFFPASSVYCVSDGDALEKLALMVSGKRSNAVLDVGAEVSFLNSQTLPFGIRALERKIASFFKVGLQDAENMMRKLTHGTLDYAHERAVNKIINEDISQLLEEKPSLLKNRGDLFISGAGADFHILKNTIKARVLSPDVFKEKFISSGALSGGKDAVLTALILAYSPY